MRTFLGSLASALPLAALLPAAPAAAVGGICEPPVITGQAAICPGATVRLVATTSVPYGEWTCQWYRDTLPIPGANDEELFVTAPGDYQAIVYYQGCPMVPSVPFTVAASVCQASPAGLVLDPAGNAGQSNGNGVLEPGERILFGPSWLNPGATPISFAASASNLIGPAGAEYTLFDGTADYGIIAPGNIGNCFAGSEDCYELAISNPPARPEAHWDLSLEE